MGGLCCAWLGAPYWLPGCQLDLICMPIGFDNKGRKALVQNGLLTARPLLCVGRQAQLAPGPSADTKP